MSNETEMKSRDYLIPASVMEDLLDVVKKAQVDGVHGLVPDAIALTGKLELIVELRDRENPPSSPPDWSEFPPGGFHSSSKPVAQADSI